MEDLFDHLVRRVANFHPHLGARLSGPELLLEYPDERSHGLELCRHPPFHQLLSGSQNFPDAPQSHKNPASSPLRPSPDPGPEVAFLQISRRFHFRTPRRNPGLSPIPGTDGKFQPKGRRPGHSRSMNGRDRFPPTSEFSAPSPPIGSAPQAAKRPTLIQKAANPAVRHTIQFPIPSGFDISGTPAPPTTPPTEEESSQPAKS